MGVTFDADQVRKAQEFFAFRGISQDQLHFELCNIYDLPLLGVKFDQIICSETLEHIARDWLVVRHFHALLRDGGVLHLCCPFSKHPDNHGRFETTEDAGWHVRDGYTLESYRALLEPAGFEIVQSIGLGSPLLVRLARLIQSLWFRRGLTVALPLFLLTWPLQFLDYLNPKVPLSLYVQAVKKF